MSIKYEMLKAKMPYKYKVQTAAEYGCNCVAYVDARQVQDKLDEVCGPNNWQTKYETINGQLFCHLGIWDDVKEEWTWKSDTGSESMAEKEKGLVSDAFKRAAVQWGVGRFLYSLGIKKTKAIKDNRGKWVPAENGKRIWDLTAHFKSDKVVSPTSGQSGTPDLLSPVSASTTLPATTDTYTQEGRPDRYSKEKANASYDKSHAISPDTMAKIRELNRDGKKGGDVLKSYLPKYNESKGTKYVASDLKTDELINSLIEFIDDNAPSDI